MRLQKYLAACGIASRRQCERLIEEGRVGLNGAVAALGDSVDEAKDAVTLDGCPLRLNDKVYIVFNKPQGVVTTAKDTHQRQTVLDCLDGVRARVFPVGRLDMDVEGALLLTNDGELAQRLMHPRYEVEKVYVASVEGRMSLETAQRLAQGVALDDGMTAPAEVRILERQADTTRIQLTLHEGRKREVKRMCAAVNHPIRHLRRVAVGDIKAAGLQPGEWRYLADDEVAALRSRVGLP